MRSIIQLLNYKSQFLLVALLFFALPSEATSNSHPITFESADKAMVVAASQSSPVPVLRQASNGMIASLERNKGRLKNNTALIYSIVRKNLLPIIDTNRMAALVVGRQFWLSATEAQKRKFISEFTQMVTSTYAAALASYDDDIVKFYPLRGDYSSRRTVGVRSVIIRKNGQRIPVSYNMVRSGGSWRVYDFSIENISIVRSYNSQFAPVLQSGGLAALINKLEQHNR